MSGGSGFQLSGNAPAAYEKTWVPALMGPCAEQLADAAGITEGQCVLDLGCGSGIVARTVARRVGPNGSVAGADVNAGMLEEARMRAAEFNAPRITWHHNEEAELPFAEESFDAVLCQQGLQFMPDRPAVMVEIARVLKPGGTAALSVWCKPSLVSAVICENLDRCFGAGTTADWRRTYSLSDPEALRSLALQAGFEQAEVSWDVKIITHSEPAAFVEGVLSSSPHATDIASLPADERSAFLSRILAGLACCIGDEGLACGIECHTLTAMKKQT